MTFPFRFGAILGSAASHRQKDAANQQWIRDRHREKDKLKKASSSIGSIGSIRRQKEKETRLEGEEGETN